LSFYERRSNKGWLPFGGAIEREWERWVLKLSIREARSEEELKKYRQMLERNLQGCLLYIATMTSEYRDHIPETSEPIRSPSFRISVPNGGAESWGGILKKIISETTSTSILN
jgi:hypothetical protein